MLLNLPGKYYVVPGLVLKTKAGKAWRKFSYLVLWEGDLALELLLHCAVAELKY